MDPRIQNLKFTTCYGQRWTWRQIATLQAVVRTFPKLSRTHLGHTPCKHLGWQIPKGRNRMQQAQRLLEALEQLGMLRLPPQRGARRARQQRLGPGSRSASQPAIAGSLRSLGPLQWATIRLASVACAAPRRAWRRASCRRHGSASTTRNRSGWRLG